MESNKTFVPVPTAVLELPPNKNINIFYSSFTSEPEKHDEDKLTRKQEQILKNFHQSKSFRLKGYFWFTRLIFEQFLQNYIHNFEESENATKTLNQNKLKRIIRDWKKSLPEKASPSKQFSKPKTKGTVSPIAKKRKVKEAKDQSPVRPPPCYDLDPELESEYNELIQEFRKVLSSYRSLSCFLSSSEGGKTYN